MFQQPSQFQTNIWSFIKTGTGDGLVDAVAGSGKTTTLVKGIEMVKPDAEVAMFAFNKSIVEELHSRIPNGAVIKTLHSLGMSPLMKRVGATKVNSKKQQSIAFSSLKKFKVLPKEAGMFVHTVTKMVDMVRFNNIEIQAENIMELGLYYGFMIAEREVKAIQHCLSVSNDRISHEIDFVDMLYQPVRLDLQLPKYDYVFIDEAQDLSIIQQELFKRTIKRNGRFLAVGDPHQAIYGFAGADSDSFQKLADLPNMTQMPLSVCYRCDKSIINKAQRFVPHIQSHAGAEIGSVRNGLTKEVKPGDMVLSRNNKPLVSLCIQFFEQGRKSSIKGLDFGGELINMIKLADNDNIIVSSKRLDRVAEQHYNRLHDFGVEQPEKTASYKNILEKIEILREIVYPKVKTTSQAVELIKDIFKEKVEKNKITLSTIHKAKGLENKRVFVAAPDTLPSKMATEPWELVQERNLQYVCYTRAKNELVFLVDTIKKEKVEDDDEED